MNRKHSRFLAAGVFLIGGSIANLTPGQPLFPNQTFFTTWDSPNFVTGDFNSDGNQDLAGAHFTSQVNEISIVFGNGDGTFSPRVGFPTGENPISIAKGDFNGDSIEDLVTVGQTASPFDTADFCALLGNGDGTFAPPVCLPAGQGPTFIAVGEFNSDTAQDVVVLNGGAIQDAFVFLGNGDGTFAFETSIPVGTTPSAAVVEDFDGDGNQDLAVAQSIDDNLAVFLGNGDATFDPPSLLAAGDSPGWVATGDFNQNGKLDLVSANFNSDDLFLFRGLGNGNFAQGERIPAGDGPEMVTGGDLNGDGILDLAVTLHFADETLVLLGQGNGAFGPAIRLPTLHLPLGIVITELNGDGIAELAVANTVNVSVFLGAGDGTFPFSPQVATGSGSQSVQTADLNADGIPDIAVGDGTILLGNGDFTFDPLTFSPPASFLIISDFNGDTIPDIAGTNGGQDDAFVILGDGDGTFGPDTRAPVGSRPEGLAAGDFNADGREDLAVANTQSETVSVLLGQGNGGFAAQVQYPAGVFTKDVAVGDFNADGREDLAAAGRGNTVSILLGNGDGTFGPETSHDSITANPGSIAVDDFDRDGALDLVVGSEGNNDVAVFLGRGDGSFDPGVLYRTSSQSVPALVNTGDFNGDGIPDIAASNLFTHNVSVLLGVGDGTFLTNQDFAASPFPWEVAVADFNLDDRPDLVTANGDAHITVLPNRFGFLDCMDGDGDGYGSPGRGSCPAGGDTDCDDSDPAVNPGAIEIGDGIDNDCNGVADEDLQLACQMSPTSLNLQSKGTTLSFQATLTNQRTGETIDPSPLDPVYFSRVFSSSGVDITLPPPNFEPGCNAFTEDGIWENPVDRNITGSGSVTFRFNLPSDGQCETLDGNRQDIIAVMQDIPDGDIAVLCIRTRFAGSNWPLGCCDATNISNHGNR